MNKIEDFVEIYKSNISFAKHQNRIFASLLALSLICNIILACVLFSPVEVIFDQDLQAENIQTEKINQKQKAGVK